MLPSLIGIIASSGGAVGGDYESIATVTVGSGGSSSISFTSIPSTYQHLQIRLIGRHTSGSWAPIYIQANGDTAANYSYHGLYGDGGSAASFGGANATYMLTQNISGSSQGSNIFGAMVIDFLDYANTNKYKTMRELGGVDANGSGYIDFNSSSWRSTSAITSLSLTSDSNFVQYSSFALYGIKG